MPIRLSNFGAVFVPSSLVPGAVVTPARNKTIDRNDIDWLKTG